MASRARSTGSGAHGAPAPPHYRSIPLEPKWLRYLRPGGGKGWVIDPALLPHCTRPPPPPARPRRPPVAPRPQEAERHWGSHEVLWARGPAWGERGRALFEHTHLFLLHPPPPRRHAAGQKWELRTASRRPPQNQAGGTGSRATGLCTYTGTFLSPRIVALHRHRYLCWIASSISAGTLCTASAPVL